MAVTPADRNPTTKPALPVAPVSEQKNASRGLVFSVPDRYFNQLSQMIISTRKAAVQADPKNSVIPNGPTVNAPDGTWSAQRLSVPGLFNLAQANPSVPGRGNPAYADRALNGYAYRITTTNQANSDLPPVIFINGINTSLTGASETAASVGELTGANVDLVYNSSDPAVGAKVTLAHFHEIAKDNANGEATKGIRWSLRHGLEFPFMVRNRVYRETMASAAFGQQGGEWAKYNALNNPPAAQTAANLILDQLNSHNGVVNVAGYSQGGAIGAEALRRVEANLVAIHGRAKADDMLSRVRFLGIGAAAESTDFPSAVKFNGIAHRGDVVPEYFGISRNRRAPGLGAILKALTPGNGWGVEQHVNYLDDQHGAGSAGDPLSERLVREWFGGLNIGEQVIRDFEP
ncbi:MAG: hypothetical protein OEM82_02600 [Acidobacteriota bacterium]|nr:hypothetical protein [Acidobacteriota bacterium]MDH3529627.1 hypothetical protein [Acidobacteriota bacterium]